MTTLYIITRFLTFPGALVRGFLEQLICRIHKIPVEDNRYLRRDELCSHIEHEFMPKPWSAFAICFFPMLIQLVLGFLVSITAAMNLLYLGAFSWPVGLIDIVCLWVGISLSVNCFPSIEDAINLFGLLYHSDANLLQKIILTPGTLICYAGSFLERYCITFLTSVGITLILALAV